MLKIIGFKSAGLAASIGVLTLFGLGYTFYPSGCSAGNFPVGQALAAGSCEPDNLTENGVADQGAVELTSQEGIETDGGTEAGRPQQSTDPSAPGIAATTNQSASTRRYAGSSVTVGKRPEGNTVELKADLKTIAMDEGQTYTETDDTASMIAYVGGQSSSFGAVGGSSGGGGDSSQEGDSADEDVAETIDEDASDSGNEEEADSGSEEVADAGEDDVSNPGDEEVVDSGEEDTVDSGDEEVADSDEEAATDTGNQEVADSGEEQATDSGDEEVAESGDGNTAGSGNTVDNGSEGDESSGSDGSGGHDYGGDYDGGYGGDQTASVPEMDASSVGIAFALMLSLVAFLRERRRFLSVRS